MNKKSFIINKGYDPLILRTVLKRFWWWPISFIICFILVAFVYLRYTKPMYESSMVLQLADKDSAKDVLDIENINSKDNELSSVVELLRSELLFGRALGNLNLSISLFSEGQILREERYKSGAFNIQPYALNDSILINQQIEVGYKGNQIELTYNKNGQQKKLAGPFNGHLKNEDFDVVVKVTDAENFKKAADQNYLYFIFNSLPKLTERMISGLNVRPIDPNAKTIDISFRGHNAQLCRDVITALSNAFIEYDEEQKRKGSENIIAFIDSQLDSLAFQLKVSKDSLMNYQQRVNFQDPETQGMSVSSSLIKLEDKLFIAEDEYNSLLSVKDRLKSNPNRLEVYRLLPEMLGKSYEEALTRHIQELHGYMERKEDLSFELTDESSELRLINRKIESKLATIQQSIGAVERRLMRNVKTLRLKVGELNGELSSFPEKKMEFGRLKGIQELNDKYYNLLTEKKVLYEISDAGYSSSNRILRQAKVDNVPVAPNKRLIYSSFVMFGLLLGLGVVLLKYLTFNEINLIEDLENILPAKASILGGVPLFKYSMEYSQLIVSEMPKSIMAEAMRKIRTNLSYIKPDYQTIAVSSSISGEGKTFVALNLGGIIAMSGKKTVLLDLDLRKPKVHLGLDAENVIGMSSLIVGQAKLEDCIKKSSLENFDFIPAGPIPPNPSELLLSDAFTDIVDQLKGMYDVIVIDNPPIGLVSDGIKNLTDADIPIYVFKSHYSKRNFAHRIKELFEMQQLNGLNVILNGVNGGKSSVYGYGYGYGGYGYGYGYSEGYTEEDAGKFKEIAKEQKWYRRIFRFRK